MDLKQDDFQIYEDGEVQKTQYFALADTPRSTMLIYDRSGSAEKQDPFMLESVKVFMQAIRSNDRLAIFSFSKELEVRLPWQGIVNGKQPKVSMPPPQDGSGVYYSIDRAGKRFDKETGRKAIIMLTDGNDSEFFNNVRTLGGVLDIAKDSIFQGYLKKFRKQDIPVYFVALDADPHAEVAFLQSSEYQGSNDYIRGFRSPTIAQDFLIGAQLRMEKIAEATGGRVLVPTRIADVAAEYGKIARELGTSYSLGYAPSTASGGNNHRIEVRVRRTGLQVAQSRYGYQR
jgi:VWFA-related protein